MITLTYSAAFFTFFSVVGPPKVLLTFAELAQAHTKAQMRTIALISSAAAALVGLVTAFAAPWLLEFFHISTPALELSGGVIFFIYAIGLVLGLPIGGASAQQEDPNLPSGVRELLLPYVVSPLALTAVLVESTGRNTWGWRWIVVLAFVSVIAVDLLCVVLLTGLLQWTHSAIIELGARLVGLLLAAVGVGLFLDGLYDLGLRNLDY